MSLQERVDAVEEGLNLGGIYDFEDYELRGIVSEVDKVLLSETAIERVAVALAVTDGFISMKHPSPAHQDKLRIRARSLVVALLGVSG